MVAYCNAVWRCRFFWLALVKMDLRSKYRGSVLGMGWSLVHPIAMTALFTAIFCNLFKKDPSYYAPYVLTGLACWQFFLQTAVLGSLCYIGATPYIRQHPAPMAIYPLRTVLGTGFHSLLALLLAIVISVFMVGECTLAGLLTLPLTLVLFLLLGWSLAVLAGLAHAHFRDTKHMLEIGFQILFYMTPVFYDADVLRGAKMELILRFNPVVPFLHLLRYPLLHGGVPDAATFARAGVVTAVAVGTALFALSRLERRLIFQL